jgi:hypothetical protein
VIVSPPPSFGYMSSELRLANGAVQVLREVSAPRRYRGGVLLAASDAPIERNPQY